MKKVKLTLFFVILIAVILLIPSMCNAATTIDATETTKTSTGKTVKWSYTLNSSNEIENLKCTNISEVSGGLTMPSAIDGHKVVKMHDGNYGSDLGTFQNCTGLTEVTLPNTLTMVGKFAFNGCTGLKSITIPNSIITIGNHAFSGCTGLKSITIPNSVTKIADSSFSGCTGLKNVTIPNSVTDLGESAFLNCAGLVSVALSENLTCINYGTFKGCSGLIEVIIPDSVTSIFGSWVYGGAFEQCTNLARIYIPDTVATINSGAFDGCSKLTIYGNDGEASKQYAEDNKIKFDYLANWNKGEEGIDITAPTVKRMEIKYSSVMKYYNSTANRYEIPKGAKISIIATFTESIKGSTAPTLKIRCGVGNEISINDGVVSGNSCIYTYEIKAGDEGLITAVSLEGGNITDTAGNKAVLSCPKLLVEYISDNTVYANSKTEEIKDDNQNNGDGVKEEDKNDANQEDKNDKNDKNDNKKDPTIKGDSKLPQTGVTLLVTIGTAILAIAIISKVKYNKYKDI